MEGEEGGEGGREGRGGRERGRGGREMERGRGGEIKDVLTFTLMSILSRKAQATRGNCIIWLYKRERKTVLAVMWLMGGAARRGV